MTIHQIRRLAALLTALVGGIDVISALYPAVPARLELLSELLPLHLARDAQTATVLVGFMLILLADGLRNRRQRAMQIAVALLVASAVLNIVKGLDFEEATLAALLGVGLIVARKTFNIRSPMPVPLHVMRRVATYALLYYCYVLAGFLILRRAIEPAPTVRGATMEPLRLLLDAPFYQYAGAQASWFERSLPFLGSCALLFALAQLLRPLLPRRRATPGQLDSVRSVLKQYGSDSLSYFSVQNDRSYFFDSSGEAYLSYRLWRNVALVGGAPVGRQERVHGLLDSFLRFAHENGIDPCFLGISAPELHLYHARGLRTIKIGEEALIDLPTFQAVNLKRKVRRAVRHAGDFDIVSQTYRRGDLPAGILDQMQDISTAWMRAKGGAERGFSMTLARLPDDSDPDCEITVAVQGERLWGYLVMVPVYQGNGWSLDAMRRRVDAPNGLMEFLVVRAAEWYQERGYDMISLNFASLCNCENDIESRTLENTRKLLFEHLSSVYQLKSLYQFNQKFEPRWRSRYMAYPDVLKFPKVALAVVQAEDPIRLPSLAGVFRR